MTRKRRRIGSGSCRSSSVATDGNTEDIRSGCNARRSDKSSRDGSHATDTTSDYRNAFAASCYGSTATDSGIHDTDDNDPGTRASGDADDYSAQKECGSQSVALRCALRSFRIYDVLHPQDDVSRRIRQYLRRTDTDACERRYHRNNRDYHRNGIDTIGRDKRCDRDRNGRSRKRDG